MASLSNYDLTNISEGHDRYSKKNLAQVWLRITALLSLKSSNTKRTYASVLSQWCEFLGAEAGSEKSAKLLLAANDMQALAYRTWLDSQLGQTPRLQASNAKNSGNAIKLRSHSSKRKDGLQSTLANSTIRKKIAALRRVYRMLISADLGIKTNPFDTDRIPPPSAMSGQKRPTEMIDFNLVKKIIDLPSEKIPKGLRDKAILVVLFAGGLRRSEVVNLRLGDVLSTQRGTLYLRLRATKAKKDADQALPTWAAKIINQLCTQRRAEGAKDGDYLFVSYSGVGGKISTNRAISDSGLYKLFKFYCQKAGAGKFVTPHSARATAITKLLNDGIGHREVQEFSRHASVQMVEVYDKRRISVDESAAKDLNFDN